jgi:hypothetical protein
MQKKPFFVLAIFAIVFSASCNLLESDDEPFRYDSVPIRTISTPDTVQVDTDVPVVINGYLPTPAWNLDRVNIFYLPKKVVLRPVGRLDRRKEPVIQIIVPFSDTVQVRFEEPGRYDIEVVGKNKTLLEQVVVE